MNSDTFESDLVVLTADKNMKYALEGLLGRSHALAIRPISVEFYIHPERDPGCLLHSDDFLRPFANRFAHAMVLLDHEGCGKEELTRDKLEQQLAATLCRSGWVDRAEVIVIDPELERWVFSDSPEVDTALGWSGKYPPLRTWLAANGHLAVGENKPARPKEAMEAALRHVRMPRSSSIYGHLAQNVGIGRCTDRSFEKLKTILQTWFPVVD
jgi:hypothetical protein